MTDIPETKVLAEDDAQGDAETSGRLSPQGIRAMQGLDETGVAPEPQGAADTPPQPDTPPSDTPEPVDPESAPEKKTDAIPPTGIERKEGDLSYRPGGEKGF